MTGNKLKLRLVCTHTAVQDFGSSPPFVEIDTQQPAHAV